MESTPSAPVSPSTTQRTCWRRLVGSRGLARGISQRAGRTAALCCFLLTSELCTPSGSYAAVGAAADCQLRHQAQAIEDVQRRIRDRWDDEALFDEDASEWMRVHRDEWEWLLRERLVTYCPDDANVRAGRTTPVQLGLFVRVGSVADRTLMAAFERNTTTTSSQYGLAGGVVLSWEWMP